MENSLCYLRHDLNTVDIVKESVIGEDNQITANAHTHDFSESLTKGLHDSTGLHLIHATEPILSRSPEMEGTDGDLDALIRKAQHEPITTAMADPSLDLSLPDNVAITKTTVQPSKLLHKT
ncbi:hypothetical protein X798_04922 [Onchocerca flexuosa]|uniref:Uncharacterized protein n=1 Tax=Onchocerca flexuosa TaxID=387005 RepID=A0A238BTM0_9BILA|nr:hypothetical protein X798_04922 [Onchocerca flexuosa]